jgi:2-keto-3-deoxy-L-rhamnonate aldolase RhmA
MNVNPLKPIWDSGGIAIGTYIMYSRDITTIQLAAAAGLDFVLFDLEHRPHDAETIHDLSQVARLSGMASLVGPREISPHAISQVLDLGASGVVIPHVETRAEVDLAIQATRYPPQGHRGRCGLAGHNLYRATRSTAEEIGHYNSDVALLLKVESESAIRRLEELVTPDEVDGVMVGPLDLSLDMGIPGQTQDTRLLKLVDRVCDVCRKRKIQYGTYVTSADELPEAIQAGASWVVFGSELGVLSETWKKARQAVPGRSTG